MCDRKVGERFGEGESLGVRSLGPAKNQDSQRAAAGSAALIWAALALLTQTARERSLVVRNLIYPIHVTAPLLHPQNTRTVHSRRRNPSKNTRWISSRGIRIRQIINLLPRRPRINCGKSTPLPAFTKHGDDAGNIRIISNTNAAFLVPNRRKNAFCPPRVAATVSCRYLLRVRKPEKRANKTVVPPPFDKQTRCP